MAHLRDAKTGELIAEGTPLEVVLVADKLGLKAGVVGPDELPGELEALYDDVGLGFDPGAVLLQAGENAGGLEAAAKDAKGEERKRLEAAHAAAAGALTADPELVAGAEEALKAAREAQGG